MSCLDESLVTITMIRISLRSALYTHCLLAWLPILSLRGSCYDIL